MLRKPLSNVSLLFIAVMCFAITLPARADGPIQVSAKVQWTDTGIALQAGQRFQVRANGTITLQAAEANKRQRLFTVIGNTRSRCTDPACPLSTYATGLLVGRIADGSVFPIGNSRFFKAANAGVLLLGVNDTTFEDNSGAFAVTVLVYPLQIPCSAAKIVLPVAESQVDKTVKISWNPATCRMNVQFYQNGILLREKKRGDASGTVDMASIPPGRTQIKIWVPGSGSPSDAIWVYLK
jgi:hypothetical protein